MIVLFREVCTQTDTAMHVEEPLSVDMELAQPVTPVQHIRPCECKWNLIFIAHIGHML